MMTRRAQAATAPAESWDADRYVARVKDLCVTFPGQGGVDVPALRGVTLDLAPGEILGVVGESGSGKSVLGLSMLGLLPDRPRPRITGSVTVCGTDMVDSPPESRRLVRRLHMGSIFQDPMTSLNPTMRVGRQVEEAAGGPEEAERLLEAVGLPDAARRMRAYPHELSGGLRQRVMIAMAVAGDPALVIADEPTTALDVTVQAQILELLVDLRGRTSTTFMLVTHDLGVAAQVADRIAVMYAGRLAELGPAEQVYRTPRHPYTQGLLRSRLELDTQRDRPLATLRGEPPDPRRPPPGCPFGPRCDHHEPACDLELPALRGQPDDRPGGVACVRADEIRAADPGDAVVANGDAWPAPAAATHPGATLIVKGLTKTFPVGSRRRPGTLHALRGVDLEVKEGEAVALVGESGCGKSTLLRSVAGLQPVDGGFIDLARGGRPQMVFQDAGASLTPWMSIGELVGERLREEGLSTTARRRRVDDALRLVGLPLEAAKAKPSQLSGGQRQRVALARATVVPPEVLLCDEPTSALDVSLAATVLNLLGRLRRELGMAVLFVTHDLAAARIVADRIAVMYLGRIVEIGSATQVTARPVHPYTRALLAAVPGQQTRRAKLQGEPASPLRPPPGCEFHPRCPEAEQRCSADTVLLAAVGDRGGSSAADVHAAACPVMIERRR